VKLTRGETQTHHRAMTKVNAEVLWCKNCSYNWYPVLFSTWKGVAINRKKKQEKLVQGNTKYNQLSVSSLHFSDSLMLVRKPCMKTDIFIWIQEKPFQMELAFSIAGTALLANLMCPIKIWQGYSMLCPMYETTD
jgi:hypothetical protein